MDQLSKNELNRIISLGSDSLTQEEKDFLFARREYLTKEQKEDFKDVIEDKNKEVAVSAKEAEAELHPKKLEHAKDRP